MGFRHMFSSAASTAESSRKKGQLMAVTWNHPTGDTDWFYFFVYTGTRDLGTCVLHSNR